MSLLNRKSTSIGRDQRVLRDDRVFVVAAEDTYAPAQYFEHLPLPRVKVVVLPTPNDSGLSGPLDVVERLKKAFKEVSQKRQVQMGDEFWVLLDTDHRFQGSHLKGTLTALRNARQVGFEIAVSNPCFELWLLLHHIDPPPDKPLTGYGAIEDALAMAVGSYGKKSIKAGQFPLVRVPDAIRRARALEELPDNPTEPWPKGIGTRVYRLMERILPATA